MTTTIQAFVAYLQKEKKYSTHTTLAYENDLVRFQQFNQSVFEQETIEQVQYSQIRSWIVLLVEQGVSSLTVNRKISSLKAYYKFLLKTKAIEVNPLLRHKSLKVSKKIQIPFSEKEMFQVLGKESESVDFESLRNDLIIDLFYTTGMRRAELIELKVSAVDFSNNILRVVGKRNKERLLPILPIIKQKIQLYNELRESMVGVLDVDYFFILKKGVKLNNSFVYRLINSYFSKTSEKVKTSPHILRHTFATHLLNNGADLNAVKELLGHATLASTQVYTQGGLAELKKVYLKAHPRSK
jgi:integrase/recombinase XerC